MNVRADFPAYTVAVETWELRTLLRIVTECRDPSMKSDVWIQNLAHRCGLDLNDPEGCKKRMASA